ncbi:sporulation transcriptional regulator SpoIIID [Clostridium magnum]|uniref:Stage III sporulation protein D n=1 Tax=Clostridium magnum DSM 2767 TaxID=1121326 RepID=A0A161W096_9CLOT|nr:sporulation transcriptional regulator SpoIIID [Clostridium magnum]KZL88500.1 stage III sporulation protein D [Clostridium magnum DSM 2767]SHJ11949.1 putative DeoR family transcriptional regulator, stage III sporulation protein D [Clostridium magnum DSM 2767]
MKDYIRARVVEVANYTIATEATIRTTAKVFGVSKSTIHKDIVERLLKVNPQLHEEVEKVILKNTEERNIRGGEATKEKYMRMHVPNTVNN